MTATHPRIARLRRALSGGLPGHAAHRDALPEGVAPPVPPPDARVLPAAVLLALQPAGDRLAFPMIRRTESMQRHAGQISLPGGVIEDGEQPIDTALRESQEEIALDPDRVRILGRLTPVYIPITRYRVQPVVGWVPEPAGYHPAEDEVIEILMADPDRFAADGLCCRLELERDGRVWSFPAYDLRGDPVWGATAQILSEFLAIWAPL